MAAYIPVPRDLSRVKTKIFMNLTKRQMLLVLVMIGGIGSFLYVTITKKKSRPRRRNPTRMRIMKMRTTRSMSCRRTPTMVIRMMIRRVTVMIRILNRT